MFMLSLLLLSEQKVINVNMKNKKPGWYYLGYFVFNGRDSTGLIQYDLDGLNASTGSGIYFYSDGNVDFVKEYQKSRNQCFVMTDAHHYTIAQKVSNGEFVVPKTPAPKYWYIAVANCNKTFTLQGKIMLNDIEWESGMKSYKTEFDYSQQLLLPVYTCSAILFGSVFIFQLYNYLFLNKNGRHLFITLNNASTTILWAGNVMYMIYLGVYANQGNGFPAYMIGEILYMGGSLVLLASILFLSQGYLLCTEKLRYKVGTWVMFGIVAVFGVSSVIQDAVEPEGPVASYPMESVTGLVYLCARACAGGLCCFMCAKTLKNETLAERRGLLLASVTAFAADLILPAIYAGFAALMPRWFRRLGFDVFCNLLDFIAITFVAIISAPSQVEYLYKSGPQTGVNGDGEALTEQTWGTKYDNPLYGDTGAQSAQGRADPQDQLGDDW